MVLSATLCLAMTIYGEARGESLEGQAAVAQVVLNRTQHDAYPNGVCAVAFEKSQFAPVTELTDIEEPEAFLAAIHVAVRVLEDSPEGVSEGATHFFSGSEIPYWADDMLVVDRIGDHTFLRER